MYPWFLLSLKPSIKQSFKDDILNLFLDLYNLQFIFSTDYYEKSKTKH